MKNIIKNILFVSVPSILILFFMLELVFRFLIPASNVPNYIFDEQYGILKFDSSHNRSGIYSVGKTAGQKGYWSINNAGWNSPYDYHRNKRVQRIAVIGDSYIEALMINQGEIYPFVMNKKFNGKKEVLAFGISGSPLSQYLHMSRYVNKEFNPDIFIFNIIHNDFDESLKACSQSPFFKTLLLSGDSTVTEAIPETYKTLFLKNLLKKSAFVRYIIFNLSASATIARVSSKEEKPVQVNANVVVDRLRDREKEIRQAVHYICRSIRSENPGKRILFVMDASRADIYGNTMDSCNVCFLNQMMKEEVSGNRMEFLDLTDLFSTTYRQNKIPFNSDIDFHWNEYGHRLVADTVFKYIQQINN